MVLNDFREENAKAVSQSRWSPAEVLHQTSSTSLDKEVRK